MNKSQLKPPGGLRDFSVSPHVISQQNIIIARCSDQKARSSFVSVKWIIMAVVQVTLGIQGSSWSPFSPVSQEFPLTRASRAEPSQPSHHQLDFAFLPPWFPWPAGVAKEVLTMGENSHFQSVAKWGSSSLHQGSQTQTSTNKKWCSPANDL